jgi:hypothetical protein
MPGATAVTRTRAAAAVMVASFSMFMFLVFAEETISSFIMD